jgi:hypothetical protein
MRSWKTTFFGYLAAIASGITGAMASGVIDPAHLPAWFKSLAALASVVGTAGLGQSARDNDKTSEQVGAGAAQNILAGRNLLLLLCVLPAAWCLSGCAYFHNTQLETHQDGTRIESKQNIYTLFDSSSQLSKLHVSRTDKTQSITLGGLNQESTTSNLWGGAGELIGTAFRIYSGLPPVPPAATPAAALPAAVPPSPPGVVK